MKFNSRSQSPPLNLPAGFSLVELLVVVLIIAILAAITGLVATKFRETALTAKDSGKFRQVGIALAGVAQDNNGIITHGNLTKDSSGNFVYPGAVIPKTNAGDGDRFNFHEVVFRYFPPPANMNSNSIYNYLKIEDPETIFCSKAAKPWPGCVYAPLPGPIWFSYNPNLTGSRWVGNILKVPDPSKIVICAETNLLGGQMKPQGKADFANNVETRYRISRAGKTALYLFLDGHVERLQGERGEAYYAANPGETNIWKWW